MDKIQQQINNFNSRVDTYVQKKDSVNRQRFISLLYQYVFSFIPYASSGRTLHALEPMCGWGDGYHILTANIPDRDIVYEGFDYSPQMIDIAKALHPNLSFQVQDITTFETEKTYDIIIIIGGLHHVPDYTPLVLDKLFRCLSTNGILINAEPTYNNRLFARLCSAVYKHNKNFDSETERRFSLEELSHMYRKAGFRIRRQFHIGLFCYLLWYNPDIFPILNKGRQKTVDRLFNVEKKLYTTKLASKISVGTITLLQKRK